MNDQSIYIFSYGSNLLFQRIRERVASAEVIQNHKLTGYQLAFNKQSVDGSTKANIAVAPNDNTAVCGVIHKISLTDKPILDRYEALGRGYDHLTFDLELEGAMRTIFAYMAIDPQYLAKGQPYDWYLNFVIEGAIENGFHEDYLRKLKSTASLKDGDTTRRKANEVTLAKSRSRL